MKGVIYMIKYIALILCAAMLIKANINVAQHSSEARTVETNAGTAVETTVSEQTEDNSAPVYSTVAVPKYPEMEEEILRLINAHREKEGVAPLEIEYAYYDCAYIRANECLEYWSHTRPDGRRSYTVYYDLDLTDGIKMMGENLAKNFKTAESIMQKLMDSPSHRKAILCAEYTHVTICIIDIEGYDGLYAMSQLFTKKA